MNKVQHRRSVARAVPTTMQDEIAAVYAVTEPHRLCCEAKFICALPTIERRRAYLELAAAKRGEAVGAALKAAVGTEWARSRQTA